jgi:hypothetical protein
MFMDLLRGICRSDPQYLATSVREAKCTRLGYGTKPILSLAFLRGNYSTTPDPKKESSQGLDKSQVPQADPPVTGLHNSNQRRDKKKVTDHMRVKTRKNRNKTEAQFYEHNCKQGEIENSWNMILHRIKQAIREINDPLRMIREADPAGA